MAAAAVACPSAQKRTPSPIPAARPAVERSSILAVLAERNALGLDADQVNRLEKLQTELDTKDAELRRAAAAQASPETTRPDATPRPAEGRRRSGRGLGGPAGTQHGRGAPDMSRASGADLVRALDDADTAAFLEAEKILRDGQRERAREIAEKYRENLYDAREAAKHAASAEPR